MCRQPTFSAFEVAVVERQVGGEPQEEERRVVEAAARLGFGPSRKRGADFVPGNFGVPATVSNRCSAFANLPVEKDIAPVRRIVINDFERGIPFAVED